ncbi:MAG: choline TMA-lyase-activating enzyme [Desulfovibrio sp. MES5]|uniref:choline TMA-lyase-activating enzyme n=1 Tax=Desulfovibrio sp. MES5 TaxID=1899016 RepID=UPI000B9C9B39|nr:choline TMA-lyase-activating enzyme [Desulfovibrio sp. MES5]OXS27795.1 MAG: choline TMA-lyase-activating enzyme [Desulfovibrio sp. MES5]
MIERKARIFNIQKYNMYDGPGIRTLVFFKGCPLRCRWCSNPESQTRRYEVMFKKDVCINCGACVAVCPVGIHSMTNAGACHVVDRTKDCINCGKCVHACPEAALAIAGEQKGISELLEVVEQDWLFYENSGGGVTVGGGEPLAQHEAVANLLLACRHKGIHTAMETSGYAKLDVIRDMADVCDLFLFDIKYMDADKHYELTGVRNEAILTNLKWLLENGSNVNIRMPLLKGYNDDDAEIHAVGRFLSGHAHRKNFKGIDLLPYHKMGVSKYAQIDVEYPIKDNPVLDDADLQRIENILKGYGLAVKVIKH